MNRKKMIEKIRGEVNNAFDNFTYFVVNEKELDYCDEMSLMYSFKKYLQYIEEKTDEITNEDLQVIVDNINNFRDDFLEIYWNSDLGNSYCDIKSILAELVLEYREV